MSHEEAAAIVESGCARNSDESAAYLLPMAPITGTSSAAGAGHGSCSIGSRDRCNAECGLRALHAWCVGRDVVEGERHRDAGVVAHKCDRVGDPDMT